MQLFVVQIASAQIGAKYLPPYNNIIINVIHQE